MWFNAILVGGLVCAAYKRAIDDFLGRLHRCLYPPATAPRALYVLVNSIESAWVAAFLQSRRPSSPVYAIPAKKGGMACPLDALYGVGAPQLDCIDAGLRAVGCDVDEWDPAPMPVVVRATTDDDDDDDWVREGKKVSPYRGLAERFFVPRQGWKSVYDSLLGSTTGVRRSLPKGEVVDVVDARTKRCRQTTVVVDGASKTIELEWSKAAVFEAAPLFLPSMDLGIALTGNGLVARTYEEKEDVFANNHQPAERRV